MGGEPGQCDASSDTKAKIAASNADHNYPPHAIAPSLRNLPDWIKAGCGNAEYFCPEKGAIFPGDSCPEIMPDLSKHNNIMAEVMRDVCAAFFRGVSSWVWSRARGISESLCRDG